MRQGPRERRLYRRHRAPGRLSSNVLRLLLPGHGSEARDALREGAPFPKDRKAKDKGQSYPLSPQTLDLSFLAFSIQVTAFLTQESPGLSSLWTERKAQ